MIHLFYAFVLLNNNLINGHERDVRGPVFFPRVERSQSFAVKDVDEMVRREIGDLSNEVNLKSIMKLITS